MASDLNHATTVFVASLNSPECVSGMCTVLYVYGVRSISGGQTGLIDMSVTATHSQERVDLSWRTVKIGLGILR